MGGIKVPFPYFIMRGIITNRNLRHRSPTAKRCFTLITAFMGMALFSYLEMARARNYCLSAECNKTATAILSRMKPNVNPCDDFYKFSCGKFIDETEIPDDDIEVNLVSGIFNKLQEQLRDVITEERPETDPKHFRLPNLLYKACMNKSLIASLGTEPVKEISDSLGGWPVIVGKSWDSSNSWSWQKTVGKFKRFGVGTNYVVFMEVSIDRKNGTKRIIELDQPDLYLRSEYLVKGFNETLVLAYYEYIVDIAVLFGAEREAARKELRQSLQFEMDLATIFAPREKRRNASALHNPWSIKQLQKAYPYVEWLGYINDLLPQGLQVDGNETINLAVPSFFDDLGSLLQRTDKRAIANYMMWRVHALLVNSLTEDFRKRELEYNTALTGKKEDKARWKECIDITADRFDISVSSLYVRKYFNGNSRAIVSEMVDNLRDAFNRTLDAVKWMDNKTKEAAKRKLHSMISHIGYPDEMLDNNKLEDRYRNLEIDPDNYVKSLLNINVYEMDYEFNKLRLPVNKTDWESHANAVVINALYSPSENSIEFPAAFLQGHFFNAQRPNYVNYGAIGYAIGHEITHGFDDRGRQYDGEGNLKDWWQPDTKKAYLEKAKCIIEQYGNYTDKQTGLNLNGINTQGENIADNGGLKGSYKAYNLWVGKNGEEPRLPGLNYTNRQIFWIYSTQTWCAKYRKEFLETDITTGVHTPHEFRVRGTLSNMEDFSHDFQCPEGASMNPVHKCEIW